jgi:hypothetical protein
MYVLPLYLPLQMVNVGVGDMYFKRYRCVGIKWVCSERWISALLKDDLYLSKSATILQSGKAAMEI